MKKKFCRICELDLPVTDFYFRNGIPNGLICKKCKQKQMKEKREIRAGELDPDLADKDFYQRGAIIVLKAMGYDINKNIHEQFIQRGRDKGWWV